VWDCAAGILAVSSPRSLSFLDIDHGKKTPAQTQTVNRAG